MNNDFLNFFSLSNITACYLGSAQSDPRKVLAEVLEGTYRLVYVTPEYITTNENFLQELNRNVQLTLVAIDEAHCVSQWGHDFRSSYRQLDFIRKVVPNVPIITLTATATPIVRNDICLNLKLKNPIVRCTGFDRKNLYLCVRNKTAIMNDLIPLMTEEFEYGQKKYNFDGTTIIYCPTKKKTEEVASALLSYGIKCETYHAGLSFSRRKKTHYKFIRDELDVSSFFDIRKTLPRDFHFIY